MHLPPVNEDEELIGLVIAVPEPWMSELTERRVEFGDEHGNQTPAHITLLPPTPIKKTERAEVFEHLQSIASSHCPFKIELRGTGSFRPVSPVVYIDVEAGRSDLIELENEIRTGILDVPVRFDFHPHVTIAQQVSDRTLDTAEDACADFAAQWTVQGFRLDRVTPDGSYLSQALFNFTAPAG